MSDSKEYDVNFFKPATKHTIANMKLVITLVIIWVVAVFGFQFLLIILNQPTPEKSYNQFESVWPGVVENPKIDIKSKRDFSKVLLMVLGKNIAVKPAHKKVLKETLSLMVYNLISKNNKTAFKKAIENNLDEAADIAKTAIGLKSDGFDKLMVNLLPTSLVSVKLDKLSADNKAALPGIMKLYLIHNQCSLTNFKFMGFPFHYWYTAQFLLIMFVLLCLIYAVITDRENKKYGLVEE